MPDESPKGPVLPETTRIPAEEIQRQLLDRLLENTTNIRSKVDGIDTKIDDLDTRVGRVEANQASWNQAMHNVELRVGQMEGRQAAYEEWRRVNSERVKDVDARGSTANAKQDAAIGQLHVLVDEAIKKIDSNTVVTQANAQVTLELKKTAQGILADPKVKALGYMLLGVLGAAIGYASHWLNNHLP